MFDDLERKTEKRIIAGVCSGLAAELGVPAGLVRLVFVLMFVPGVPLYVFLWATAPAEAEASSPRHEMA